MEKKTRAYFIVNRFIFLPFDQWQRHRQRLRKVENEVMVSGCGKSTSKNLTLPWVPIQLAKKLLEKSLEKPLEISYTGKTPKMGR